jgi:hypothetical protein
MSCFGPWSPYGVLSNIFNCLFFYFYFRSFFLFFLYSFFLLFIPRRENRFGFPVALPDPWPASAAVAGSAGQSEVASTRFHRDLVDAGATAHRLFAARWYS